MAKATFADVPYIVDRLNGRKTDAAQERLEQGDARGEHQGDGGSGAPSGVGGGSGVPRAADERPQAQEPQAFQVGDVVRLKCGGRDMVIHRIEDGEVNAAWHSDDGKPCRDFYPLAALVRTTAPGPTPKEKTEKEKMAEAMDEAAQLERMRFAHTEGY